MCVEAVLDSRYDKSACKAYNLVLGEAMVWQARLVLGCWQGYIELDKRDIIISNSA